MICIYATLPACPRSAVWEKDKCTKRHSRLSFMHAHEGHGARSAYDGLHSKVCGCRHHKPGGLWGKLTTKTRRACGLHGDWTDAGCGVGTALVGGWGSRLSWGAPIRTNEQGWEISVDVGCTNQ